MPLADLHFSFDLSQKIWSTRLDHNRGNLVLQVRDDENMDVSYFVVNLSQARISEPFAPEGSDWWCTLVMVECDILLLERYEDPQDWASRELMVYDLTQKRRTHLLKGFQLMSLANGILTGRYVDNPEEQVEISVPVRERAGDTSEMEVSPVFYPKGSSGFETVAEFLTDEDLVWGVEYLEYDEVIVISYYLQVENKIQRKLLILRDEQMLFHQVQDQNMTGFAALAFFVWGNLLVFIQNKRIINAIRL